MGANSDPDAPWLARCVPVGALTAALVAWLGLSQLLLWRFLDVMPLWGYAIGAALLGGFVAALVRTGRTTGGIGPSIATLLLCFAIALILLALGGEGRFFYANIDWQVRAAVLRDMGLSPWPFVYDVRGAPDLLRAPVGMFLVPALAFKAWGSRVADIVLLIQNAALLALLLGIGSTLFDSRAARWRALIVVLAFSGLDALGRILFRGGLSDHIENWSYLQFSSTITLAFWVPHHALAGWIGAVSFLAWRADRMSLGGYLALLPLTALWSPLGLIGAMPFAALAGVHALIARRIALPDIALPAVATLLAAPSLLYLSAAGGGVGLHIQPLHPLQWGLFEGLEVLVYVIPLAFVVRRDRDMLWLASGLLLILPFIQIGASTDLMMRGSITALTLVAILTAQALAVPGRVRIWLIAMLLIGSVTGLLEIRRALVHPAMPEVRCGFADAWRRSFSAFPMDGYLAPLSAMPAPVRPRDPARIAAGDPACWDGDWYRPG